jgi:hypothetical protein
MGPEWFGDRLIWDLVIRSDSDAHSDLDHQIMTNGNPAGPDHLITTTPAHHSSPITHHSSHHRFIQRRRHVWVVRVSDEQQLNVMLLLPREYAFDLGGR